MVKYVGEFVRFSDMASQCDDQFSALFVQHGLRCTKQRKALYLALTQSRCHPTADELFTQVKSNVAGISLATVYNTLDAFCAAGLIQKLRDAGNNGSARYDAHVDNHTHLRDLTTGEVADAPDDVSEMILKHLPDKVIADLEKRIGFDVQQIQIELVGRFAPGKA